MPKLPQNSRPFKNDVSCVMTSPRSIKSVRIRDPESIAIEIIRPRRNLWSFLPRGSLFSKDHPMEIIPLRVFLIFNATLLSLFVIAAGSHPCTQLSTQHCFQLQLCCVRFRHLHVVSSVSPCVWTGNVNCPDAQ